jgi:hypothetical protein
MTYDEGGFIYHDFLYMVGVRAEMPLLGRPLSVSFVSLRDLEYLWGSRLTGLGERSNNTTRDYSAAVSCHEHELYAAASMGLVTGHHLIFLVYEGI